MLILLLTTLFGALTCSGAAPAFVQTSQLAQPNTQAPVQHSEQEAIDLALEDRKADRIDDAIKVLVDGLNSYPDSAEMTRMLSGLYVRRGRFQDAIAVAGNLAQRNPKNMTAQRAYLRLLMINQNYDIALPLCRTLLIASPHDPEFLKTTGKLERLLGDYPVARVHLEEAVSLIPADSETHALLGIVLDQLKESEAARVQLEEAIELGAPAPELHFELSKILRQQGHAEEADRELERFHESSRTQSDLMEANLKSTEAEQAAKAGDNRKAAELYRLARSASPNDPRLAYQLAGVLDKLGDTNGERMALESAVKAAPATDPTYAKAQYQLGFLDFDSKNYPAAEEHFRAAVKASPGNFQAWDSLAATLGLEERFQEAQQAIASALKLRPGDPEALELSRSFAEALSKAQQ